MKVVVITDKAQGADVLKEVQVKKPTHIEVFAFFKYADQPVESYEYLWNNLVTDDNAKELKKEDEVYMAVCEALMSLVLQVLQQKALIEKGKMLVKFTDGIVRKVGFVSPSRQVQILYNAYKRERGMFYSTMELLKSCINEADYPLVKEDTDAIFSVRSALLDLFVQSAYLLKNE